MLEDNIKLVTYGTVIGFSGPKSLEPSQKQSKGVIISQGIIFSNI